MAQDFLQSLFGTIKNVAQQIDPNIIKTVEGKLKELEQTLKNIDPNLPNFIGNRLNDLNTLIQQNAQKKPETTVEPVLSEFDKLSRLPFNQQATTLLDELKQLSANVANLTKTEITAKVKDFQGKINRLRNRIVEIKEQLQVFQTTYPAKLTEIESKITGYYQQEKQDTANLTALEALLKGDVAQRNLHEQERRRIAQQIQELRSSIALQELHGQLWNMHGQAGSGLAGLVLNPELQKVKLTVNSLRGEMAQQETFIKNENAKIGELENIIKDTRQRMGNYQKQIQANKTLRSELEKSIEQCKKSIEYSDKLYEYYSKFFNELQNPKDELDTLNTIAAYLKQSADKLSQSDSIDTSTSLEKSYQDIDRLLKTPII